MASDRSSGEPKSDGADGCEEPHAGSLSPPDPGRPPPSTGADGLDIPATAPSCEGVAPPSVDDGVDSSARTPAELLAASLVFRPHHTMPEMEAAERIEYCPTCGLPPDFCRYGPSWPKCRPWCVDRLPLLYADVAGDAGDAGGPCGPCGPDAASKGKMLPGGKTKRVASPHVTIKKLSRGGRKCVTDVSGLETFGVKLEVAAKLFKKKLACGASVVQGEPGLPDFVEIQGDFGAEVLDIVSVEYKGLITPDKCTVLADGTKKRGKR